MPRSGNYDSTLNKIEQTLGLFKANIVKLSYVFGEDFQLSSVYKHDSTSTTFKSYKPHIFCIP